MTQTQTYERVAVTDAAASLVRNSRRSTAR